MIEEPYRWVEAISNRRDYIEHELSAGSPIVCLSFAQGILFFTLGRETRKIYEIYDRIALGAIGHPADIERLRMAAIEVASTEGFTRSAADVSLRRLANYSLSPALKSAFEQIYGPPYLARMLIAEVGNGKEPDFFVRLDYDGSLHTNGGNSHREEFGVISGTSASATAMEEFLRKKELSSMSLSKALQTALDAWTLGYLKKTEEDPMPTPEMLKEERENQLSRSVMEACVLEKKTAFAYRVLSQKELESLLS